jgi:simple sugar transport system permease protein
MGGFSEVNGVQHMLVQNFKRESAPPGSELPSWRTATPIGIIFASILFGALQVGGNIMGQLSGIPSSIIDLMLGFVMVFVIRSYYVREVLEAHREKARLKKAVNL